MEYRGRQLRHELKYIISHADYLQVKSRLKSVIDVDQNAEDGAYLIRSLYFDNHFNHAYHEKEDGIFQRKKYRIRIYNHSKSLIKLEKKEKFDSYIAKEASTITLELYRKIKEGRLKHQDVIHNQLLLEFYADYKIYRLRPRVIVDYKREPYIHKHGNVRITFDQNLQTIIGDNDLFENKSSVLTVMKADEMILEVKYDDYLPSYIRETLMLKQHQRVSASKFVMCCDADLNFNWKEYL